MLMNPAPIISRDNSASLVEQIVQLVSSKVDDKLLRTGAKMPSIRQFADEQSVSRFTVVEAYDRLVAKGYLESRRGAGFFVRERAPLLQIQASDVSTQPNVPPQLDVVWLVRNMFRQLPQEKMPGSGVLPNDWLDGELVANGLRSICRQHHHLLLHYGSPQGFLPLRQQLQLKLAELEISATPEQILTTTGVTQALDLVAREFTRPGDTIFVDDPSWFLMFASFAIFGVKVIGIPRLQDGPDIAKLSELAAVHQPKLYAINSVIHIATCDLFGRIFQNAGGQLAGWLYRHLARHRSPFDRPQNASLADHARDRRTGGLQSAVRRPLPQTY
jgi:DNA-binding transcriptional MocR family regulator